MCTDSCSMALRVPDLLSCACFHLHEIRKCFKCPSLVEVGLMWIPYFICILGKKLTPSSIPLHPPGSSASHKFLARLDIHLNFVLGAHCCGFLYPTSPDYIPWCSRSTLLHSVWWSLNFSLSKEVNGHPVQNTLMLNKGDGWEEGWKSWIPRNTCQLHNPQGPT